MLNSVFKINEEDLGLNVDKIRGDFPILKDGLHYLDTAASAQKPKQVINAVSHYYETTHANIHRGVYELSQRATEAYDQSRKTVKNFINAGDTSEVIFTRGTTEGINLIAQTYGRQVLKSGDSVLLTGMEHHSNIVPWQILCEEVGAKIEVVPVTDEGTIELSAVEKKLTDKTKILSVVHVSNALGTINPIKEITELAHSKGVTVVVDGAQSIPHLAVDVKELDCDFYAFSGHKVYGPTGIGVLYGKKVLLEAMPPYQGGGDMILSVSFAESTYQHAPQKFEAGTPNIAGAVGLACALDYVSTIGFKDIQEHDAELVHYAHEQLSKVTGLRIIAGGPENKTGVVSFVLDFAHPHDVGTILDKQGVALRTGHHCTQPLMERFQVPATARASFGIYTAKDDIDALVSGIEKVREIFG